uniref:Pirin N-terminal domain-containing protein n=2 Tax=Lotharella globosa TaxID=91324 RepID=A0A6U3D9N1_9EUKA|mmetsp:Transcript_40349/g.78531  ORF Transcript_40349/g.78531 Transcript_40349/m.78531 type:complete len:207 (-) Transcript_40349:174-794(-)
MNDDLVQAKRGFGEHPHRNAEICTYVVHGQLTHQDSMGTKESLGKGSIQFMTAGTGVRHSEHNLHEEPLRFIQMWLTPKAGGLKPNYGSMCGSKIDTKNKLGHLVSSTDTQAETPVKINCDANIHVAELQDEKNSVDLELGEDRQAYFLSVEGTPTVSGDFGTQKFQQHDAAELYGGGKIKITGPGHVLIVEMAKDGKGGRGDLDG